MPEGPEVAIIATVLDSEIKGKKIKNVSICRDSRYNSDGRFDELIGKEIKTVQFKGKKIIFVLKNKKDISYLVSSLGMEGRWTLCNDEYCDKHLSVMINFTTGENLGFWDHRHFGDLVYYPNQKDLEFRMRDIGPAWIPSELYPDVICKEYFVQSLQNKRLFRKNIMTFLMDQKYSAGVGNYIRAEALYISRINPHRLINDITEIEASDLFDAIMSVMKKAFKSGGHTIKSYYTPIGETGGYTPLVYNRKNALDTNATVVKEMDSQNRTIHWVPSLQV